jgi:hypothetical protein
MPGHISENVYSLFCSKMKTSLISNTKNLRNAFQGASFKSCLILKNKKGKENEMF